MIISLEILSALAERPDGEAPIGELRGQLVKEASNSAHLATHPLVPGHLLECVLLVGNPTRRGGDR